MARDLLQDAELIDPLFRRGFKYSTFVHTLAADNYQITVNHPTFMDIDAGGSPRDVLLPAEASSEGLFFWFYNSGGETLTIKDDGDSSTIATLTAGAFAICACVNGTWRGAVFDQTVAASIASLTVTGNSDLNGSLNVEDGLQTQDVAVTATADGLTTGLIPATASKVSVTSANAAHIARLPEGTAARVGMEMDIYVGSNGCHLVTFVGSNDTINGNNVDGQDKSFVVAANTFVRLQLVATGIWLARLYGTDGAPDASSTTTISSLSSTTTP